MALVLIPPWAAPMGRSLSCRVPRRGGFPQGLTGAAIGRRRLPQQPACSGSKRALECAPHATRGAESVDAAKEAALFRNNEPLLLGETEVSGTCGVRPQPRAVGLVVRQAFEGDQPEGNVVGALV